MTDREIAALLGSMNAGDGVAFRMTVIERIFRRFFAGFVMLICLKI
jgi:hypothetical protein